MSAAQSEVKRSMSADSKPSKLRVTISVLVDTGLAYGYGPVLPRKDQDDRRRACPAGPRLGDPRSRAPLRARHAAQAPVPGRDADGRLRHGLLLGRRAQVLGGRWRLHD